MSPALLLILTLIAAPARAATAENYWSRYAACLKAVPAAECPPDTKLPTGILDVTSTLTRPACIQDDMMYTGTGFRVDLKSCGPRPDCGFPENTCAPKDFEAKPPKNALIYTCEDCTEKTEKKDCRTCRSRADLAEPLMRATTAAVSRLQACLQEDYKALKTAQEFLRGFGELGFNRTGAELRCPAEATSKDSLAETSLERARVSLSDKIFRHGFGEERVQAILGHEVLHLVRFDNLPRHEHNDPFADRPDGFEPPLDHSRYDRVFACSRLCFEGQSVYSKKNRQLWIQDFVSKEECELCVGPKSTGSCEGLLERKDMAAIEGTGRALKAGIKACGKEAEASVVQCRMTAYGQFNSKLAEIRDKYPKDKRNAPAYEHLLKQVQEAAK